VKTNADLFALASAPLAPAALHAKLVAELTAAGFEYILRTVDSAAPSPLLAASSPAVLASPAVASVAASEANSLRTDSAGAAVRVVVPADAPTLSSPAFATRTRRAQTMPDESAALDFLASLPGGGAKSKARAVEEPAPTSPPGKARRSGASAHKRRSRHKGDEKAAEARTPEAPSKDARRKRHGKKEKSDDGAGKDDGERSGDKAAAAAAAPGDDGWLVSPRGKKDAGAIDDASAFVHKLDPQQISAIANKQYAQLASPKKRYAYIDKPRDKDVRQFYDESVRHFNEGGAAALVDYLGTQSADNAVSIAQTLVECEPLLDHAKLGQFLSDDAPLSTATVQQVMLMMPNLKGADVLSALRRVISFVRLPSEAQRLTRYLTSFCEAYVATNPKVLKSANNMFTLCYALLSLNAATHSPDGGGKRFSNSQFEAMVEDVIKAEPALNLQMVRDMRENVRINEIVQRGDGMHSDLKRRGWLDVQQAGGLFTSGWKRKWCVLAHNVLYVAKDAAASELLGELWTVPLRDVLAVRGPVGGRDWAITLLPVDGTVIEYSAKDDKGVFERCEAPKLVFSTSSAALLKHWIDDINDMVQQNTLLVVDDDRLISSPSKEKVTAAAAVSSSSSKHRRRHGK
jgi:hypothetical protein